jgi:hypothetical protein
MPRIALHGDKLNTVQYASYCTLRNRVRGDDLFGKRQYPVHYIDFNTITGNKLSR